MRGIHQFLAELAGACLMLALPVICQANTITVNSLADPGASGICALRDAITAANTEAAVNGCVAGSGNDAIAFSTGLIGTITITATLPAIAKTLTIQGPSATPPAITIDGTDTYQVMDVNSGATLNLSYLTIENGSAGADTSFLGGGIYNQGALSVTNSTFSGNISGLGGGIASSGTLTITSSTFSVNNALQGAGIANFNGTVSVTNSTFSGNSGGLGGGIMNFNGTLGVTNSTFSGNTTGSGGFGGGIASGGGTLTVTNCTFSGNDAGEGGGIYNDGRAADIRGAILADNSGGNCLVSFPTTDEGFNLDDDGSCGFSSGTTPMLISSSTQPVCKTTAVRRRPSRSNPAASPSMRFQSPTALTRM